MDETTRLHLKNIFSKDKTLQNAAYTYLMTATESPVNWAYDVWDDLLAGLQDKDNRVRAITSQILSNLAKSDPDKRMLEDFPALLAVTKDERFVTARHCLHSLWKVGAAGPEQQNLYVAGLKSRFLECITEKNCTLIRFDIIQSLQTLYETNPDEMLRKTAVSLINSEEDLKYRKKYAKLWPKEGK